MGAGDKGCLQQKTTAIGQRSVFLCCARKQRLGAEPWDSADRRVQANERPDAEICMQKRTSGTCCAMVQEGRRRKKKKKEKEKGRSLESRIRWRAKCRSCVLDSKQYGRDWTEAGHGHAEYCVLASKQPR